MPGKKNAPIYNGNKTQKNENTPLIDKTTLPEDRVRLKPFLGIKPGVYLAFIYSAALIVILFFVLFYPALSNPGAVLSVKTEPHGAAVFLDGVYMKASPCEIFVSRGLRRVEVSLPGFTTEQVELDVKGRVFASMLFPQKIAFVKELKAVSPAASFIDEAAEFAAWTFTGEPSATYQIPLSLSEGAYRFGPYADDPVARDSMEATLAAAARFTSTRASLRDLVRSKTLLDNLGLSPSPVSLLSSLEDIITLLDENPEAAIWLSGILTGENRSALTSSSWYSEAARTAQQTSAAVTQGAGVIQRGRLNFRMIPGGTNVQTFYISETVISAAAWEAFLEEEPRWKKENKDALVAAGLANEGYLEGVPGVDAEAVSGISWYAADAFCRWLNLRYASEDTEVRLPTEAEWEYAAKSSALDYGRFWEWCEDPFAHNSFIPASEAAIAALGSPERSLRGGSFINTPGSVGIETRASLQPSFCSPFVSFRPVIAPKRSSP